MYLMHYRFKNDNYKLQEEEQGLFFYKLRVFFLVNLNMRNFEILLREPIVERFVSKF